MKTEMFVVCAGLCASVACAVPTLRVVTMPNFHTVGIAAISADGRALTGQFYIGAGGQGFHWSNNGGFTALGGATPGSWGQSGSGISGDGSVVVGSTSIGGTKNVGFRWTQATGIQDLGNVPGSSSDGPIGISHNGSVIVGNYTAQNTDRTFRWTAATGMQPVPIVGAGDVVTTRGLSGDGAVITGHVRTSTIRQDTAFRWSSATGTQALGTISGYRQSYGNASNYDGSVVVGYCYESGARAFRWTEAGGMQDIGTLWGASIARGVSADGRIVVGNSMVDFQTPHAMAWTQALGMIDLNTYVTSLGVDLQGLVLRDATCISADGMTIAGTGMMGSRLVGFMIEGIAIPAPGAIGVFVAGGLISVRRRRA